MKRNIRTTSGIASLNTWRSIARPPRLTSARSARCTRAASTGSMRWSPRMMRTLAAAAPAPQKHRSTPQQHDRPPPSTTEALRIKQYHIRSAVSDAVLTLSSNSSPCERRSTGGAGGATQRRSARRRSSNRSWTRSSWSAPRITPRIPQLQRPSVVVLRRFCSVYPRFLKKNKSGRFLRSFSWRFFQN